jgi:uncharacterized protein YycO
MELQTRPVLKKYIRKCIVYSSRIHAPFSRKILTQSQCENFISILKDGDVVFSHVRGELTNLGLSHWSHAGIFYKGKIYEATTSGVHASDPMFFMAKKDDITIYRPTFSLHNEALEYFLNSNLNVPYDFDFEDGEKEFYCFELVARSYFYSTIGEIQIKKFVTPVGKKYLASSLQDIKYFKKVI